MEHNRTGVPDTQMPEKTRGRSSFIRASRFARRFPEKITHKSCHNTFTREVVGLIVDLLNTHLKATA